MSTFLSAQTSVLGSVTNDSGLVLSSVLVFNIRTGEKSFTTAEGNFSIAASPGDELRFVRQNYERLSARITPENYSLQLKVVMQYIPTDIEEVEIGFRPSGDLTKDSKLLNRVDKVAQLQNDIGLPKPVQNSRAPASELVNDVLLPIVTGQLNVQALYNIVSGKARRQKNLYKFQDFQEKVTWLRSNLSQSFFRENNIEDAQISDFLNFAFLNNEQLKDSVKRKNLSKATFILLELAPQYLNRS